ncbi:hypothetical protein, partial [Lysinibacillus sp. NPDC097868]
WGVNTQLILLTFKGEVNDMKKWISPKMDALQITKFDNKILSIESALYASGGHRGELTRN